MRNEIEIVNYSNDTKQEATCYITGQKFTPTNGVLFQMDGRDVCPEVAFKNGFKAGKNFILPYDVNSRNKLSAYLEKIGIKRNENLSTYNRLYSELGQGLPFDLSHSEKPAGHTVNFK
jgi:hypothetical protein